MYRLMVGLAAGIFASSSLFNVQGEPVTRTIWVSIDKSVELSFGAKGKLTELDLVGKCVKISSVGEPVGGGFNVASVRLADRPCSRTNKNKYALSTKRMQTIFQEVERISQICLHRIGGILDVGCETKLRLFPKIPFPPKFAGEWDLNGSKIVIRPDGVVVSFECIRRQTVSLIVLALNVERGKESSTVLLSSENMTPMSQLGCGSRGLVEFGRRLDWKVRMDGSRLRVAVGKKIFYLEKN